VRVDVPGTFHFCSLFGWFWTIFCLGRLHRGWSFPGAKIGKFLSEVTFLMCIDVPMMCGPRRYSLLLISSRRPQPAAHQCAHQSSSFVKSAHHSPDSHFWLSIVVRTSIAHQCTYRLLLQLLHMILITALCRASYLVAHQPHINCTSTAHHCFLLTCPLVVHPH